MPLARTICPPLHHRQIRAAFLFSLSHAHARAASSGRRATTTSSSSSTRRKSSGSGSSGSRPGEMSLSEACRILNVRPPQGGKADMDLVMKRFKRLYDVNEPNNGGSFYLQSKVLRARERIEAEVRRAEEEAEKEAELANGWRPKLFRP